MGGFMGKWRKGWECIFGYFVDKIYDDFCDYIMNVYDVYNKWKINISYCMYKIVYI